ncbi:MAG: GNAT family N-acetyltransferase [Candidatus Neomarinimicrobiota bacterium]
MEKKTNGSRQLTLDIAESTRSRVIASSPFGFQVELIERVGEEDVPQLILISEHLVEEFIDSARLTKASIRKYFNYPDTLPFVARYRDEIIGYIIGVPLEYFSNDPSFQCDSNMGKKNTLYTYAFTVMKEYKGNGYAKTLKRVYLSWAKKKNFEYVSGHVREGISQRFTGDVQVLQRFENWHGTRKIFEYYRRVLNPPSQAPTWPRNPPVVSKV